MIDPAWLPRVSMRRIHWHWPAGGHYPNQTDLNAYHLLVDVDGKWHKGRASIALNSGSPKPGYAAHTLNANSDAIGIALCGMGGAQESPFDPGKWPIRPIQVDTLVAGCRQLGEFYDIPVTRKTMLSHAEVQSTLGIQQRNKWDWTRLPDDVTTLRGAHAIGDWIRGRIAGAALPVVAEPIPTGATGRVTASSLIARNAPNGTQVGSLPRDTIVSVDAEDGTWLQVTTPAGFTVWVSREHVEIIDGPRPIEPTKADPRRAMIAEIRKQLDALEASL